MINCGSQQTQRKTVLDNLRQIPEHGKEVITNEPLHSSINQGRFKRKIKLMLKSLWIIAKIKHMAAWMQVPTWRATMTNKLMHRRSNRRLNPSRMWLGTREMSESGVMNKLTLEIMVAWNKFPTASTAQSLLNIGLIRLLRHISTLRPKTTANGAIINLASRNKSSSTTL